LDHVYRRFTPDDLFHTTINAQPQITLESSSLGWFGNTSLGNNSLSLYGDVRSRTDVGSGSIPAIPDADPEIRKRQGLELYPIDEVDTHSIDKVISVSGQYPATGSINFVALTNSIASNMSAVTDINWYDEHYAPINLLSDWYHRNRYAHYPALGTMPQQLTVIHIPEMFYGRQIATGSVSIQAGAWMSPNATYPVSGVRYFVDDGYGRLWDVPSGSSWRSGTDVVGNVFYNEGLIVFTKPAKNWHNEFFSGSFFNATANFIRPLYIQFRGNTIMKSYVFMCRMPQAAVNASNNPTYYSSSIGPNGEPQRWSKFPSSGTVGENRTYITAIGIYNEERQLVAVAKLAQPIRKRESDNIDIRLRLDI
jgi:hypothetical protein